MQLKDVLQQIQNVFAEQIDLTIFITDCRGEPITSPSNKTAFFSEVTQQNWQSFKAKINEKTALFQKIQCPILIDAHEISDFLGFKLLVAPIQIEEQNANYAWAGVIIEQGYKNWISQNLSGNVHLPADFKLFKELTFLEIEDKRQIIKNFSAVATELFLASSKLEELESAQDRLLMRMTSLLEMRSAMDIINNKKDILNMLVDTALKLFPGDFCIVSLIENPCIYKVVNPALDENALMQTFNKSLISSTPKLLETEWGTVLQYPMKTRKKELGGLTIHLSKTSNINESEVILTNLIQIASDALSFLVGTDDEMQLNSGHSMLDSLTGREMEVLHQLMKGYSNQEIANQLFISSHTVKNHISNIFQKIGVSDRSQLIAMVYQLNIKNV